MKNDPVQPETRLLTRRRVLKSIPLSVAAASVAAGGLFRVLPAHASAALAPLAFDCGRAKFPILFDGDRIQASRSISSIEFFRPLFGAGRPVVNPDQPAIEAREWLVFSTPGEYYLQFNGEPVFLKVLVLSRREPISAAMLRFFDFCVANLLYSGAHDDLWYGGRDQLIDNWFRSCEPLMLSCAPTHALFRRIVERRFALPTRVVSFTGTYFHGERIVTGGHNIPEVYLPDLGRWVLFEPNHGYVARWVDSMEIATAIHRKWGDRLRKHEDWRQLGLDFYVGVSSHPIDWAGYHRALEVAGSHLGFSQLLVRKTPMLDGDRSRALRALTGGSVYWGAAATALHPTGTEFLPDNGAWGCEHHNKELKASAAAAIAAGGFPVPAVEPKVLRQMLENGHAATIRLEAWRDRVPELAW